MDNQDALARKLGLKPGMVAYVWRAPASYQRQLSLAETVQSMEDVPMGVLWLQAFYGNQADLLADIQVLKSRLSKDGQLWICWPKKAAKVETDLSDSVVRAIGLEAGLVDVKVAAINDIWSGLKFVYRLADR